MVSELPSDLLIFSPAVVIQALCIQYDANACPAARDCACSFSWCGKRRSTPPPWMSKALPRYLPAIAEHSMCQPGATGTPRAGPGGGLRLGLLLPALPQGEVARVALPGHRLRVGGHLRGLHVVDALPGQLAVRRPRADVEVDVAGAVLGGVGVPAGDQLADQLEHLGHVPGGGRLVGGRRDVQRGVRPVELAVHLVGEVVPGPALLGGLDEDLVVDVGDVADERDVVAAVPQPALEDVEVHPGAHVPDVRLGLDRQAAQVDAGLPLLEGREVADVAGRGVVEPEGHRVILGAPSPPPRIVGPPGVGLTRPWR